MTARGSYSTHRPRYRTDWFRMLADLREKGLRASDVAELIDVPRNTLLAWKNGTEPAHHDGDRLIELWCEWTEKARHQRPLALR